MFLQDVYDGKCPCGTFANVDGVKKGCGNTSWFIWLPTTFLSDTRQMICKTCGSVVNVELPSLFNLKVIPATTGEVTWEFEYKGDK